MRSRDTRNGGVKFSLASRVRGYLLVGWVRVTRWELDSRTFE